MTEQEWNILAEITKKAEINGRMGLTDEELEILREARKKLRFHERMRLSNRWDSAAVGAIWPDFGEISESMIEIDDNSSKEREERPYAYVYLSDGHSRRVETIDIIESLKRNPTSIGHPAITFAIYHWQEVIQAERVIVRDDVYSQSDMGKVLKREFGGVKELEVAKRNLKALTEAFHTGIRERKFSNEVAFAVKVRSMGLDSRDNLLCRAWERLAAKHIEQTDEVEQRRNKIELHLREIERDKPNLNTDISIRKIMDFLSTDGTLFVYNEESEGGSPRPTWKAFRNAFLAWHFQVKRTSVQEYLEKASTQNIPETVYRPSWDVPKASLVKIFHYVLAAPLATVGELLAVREDVGVRGLAGALEDLVKDGPESN